MPARPDDWQHVREGGFFEVRDGQLQLHVCGKGEKLRSLAVNDEVRAAIERHLKAAGLAWDSSGRMFHGLQGRTSIGLAQRSIRRVLHTRCTQAGISGKTISCHSMRKTAATTLLNQGVDLQRVRRLLRHSSLTITQRYLAIDGDGGAAMRLSYAAGDS